MGYWKNVKIELDEIGDSTDGIDIEKVMREIYNNKFNLEEKVMEDKVKEVTAEINNFLLWYYHKNYDESKGEVRNLYDAIDHYVDEVMDLESEVE
tara:strand:- start:859 stop:1143 length:285 start_codon:yes stop_codon:yes gene_type:complete